MTDDKEHPLLNRQVVYTGITRAKKRAVIAGTGKALTAALSRKIERDTGIALGGDARPAPTSARFPALVLDQ